MFLFGSSPCIYLVPSDTTARQHLFIFPLKFSCTPHPHCLWCKIYFFSFFFVLDLLWGTRIIEGPQTLQTAQVVLSTILSLADIPLLPSALMLFREGFTLHFFPLPDKWLNVQQYQTHGCFSSRYRRRLPSTSHRLTLWYSLTWKNV